MHKYVLNFHSNPFFLSVCTQQYTCIVFCLLGTPFSIHFFLSFCSCLFKLMTDIFSVNYFSHCLALSLFKSVFHSVPHSHSHRLNKCLCFSPFKHQLFIVCNPFFFVPVALLSCIHVISSYFNSTRNPFEITFPFISLENGLFVCSRNLISCAA